MSSYFRGGHVSAAFLYRKPTFRFLLELDDCFGDLAKDSGSRLGSKGKPGRGMPKESSYSTRNVVVGSVRVAATVGIRVARTVTAMSSIVEPKQVSAS